ncbi:MAG: cell division protein FtsQ [Flavobacteriales bacterium]|jgi:cell division protein FtsQ
MKHKIKHITLWIGTIAVALLLFGFASTKHSNARCWKMDIEVEHLSGLYFIDKASIKARILNLGDPILGTKLDSIRIDHIRQTLVQLPSVNTAEVYTTVDGILKVTVTQRTPLFRVINKQGDSFYVDTEGGRMPLSQHYTARVPVLTGSISTTFAELTNSEAENALLEEAYRLFQFLETDPLWSAQTEHIVVDKNHEFELIPRVGTARILIGKPVELEDKFKRLKAFYLEMAHNNNINKYKRINVKYRDQVVCERYY